MFPVSSQMIFGNCVRYDYVCKVEKMVFLTVCREIIKGWGGHVALYRTHLERGTPPRHLAGYRKSPLAAHQNRGYSHFRFLVPT